MSSLLTKSGRVKKLKKPSAKNSKPKAINDIYDKDGNLNVYSVDSISGDRDGGKNIG